VTFLEKKPVTLIIYGSGGHKEQMKRLLALMKTHAEFDFVSISDTKDNFNSLKHFECNEPRDKFSKWKAPFQLLKNAFTTSKQCIQITRNYKVTGLVSTGPGMVILPALIFKLLGKKVIFLESWSRFYSRSLTGKVMYRIADTFFVQNEDLLALYPNAIYSGRL
jgi:beta-1,4-N-acetylglucosaminyltransferase